MEPATAVGSWCSGPWGLPRRSRTHIRAIHLGMEKGSCPSIADATSRHPPCLNVQVSVQSGSVLVTDAPGPKGRDRPPAAPVGSDPRLSGGRGGRGWIQSVLQLPEL